MLEAGGGPAVPFRVIRSDRDRAVVEIDHLGVPAARTAWNGPAPGAERVSTRRTWGTLIGAKRWLRRPGLPPKAAPAEPPEHDRGRRPTTR